MCGVRLLALATFVVPLAAGFAASRLRLITLDLDDTLWPTARVVHAANTHLLSKMQAEGITCTTSELQSHMRLVRWGWQRATPPTYSEQRLAAIAAVVRKRHPRGVPGVDADILASTLFAEWLGERHAAAERLLFPGALDALSALRVDHPDAALVAVTNGRGNPLDMPLIAPFFDFCVSGEDGDIHPHRKPSRVIYQRTLERAQCGADAWAHVGDCKLNDVGAAKSAGAFTVWLSPSLPPTPPADFGVVVSTAALAPRTAGLRPTLLT